MAAFGLAAPSISGSIGAPAAGSGGRDLDPGYLGPPGGRDMTPDVNAIKASPTMHDVSGTMPSPRANIRMSTGDMNASQENFMRHSRSMAGGNGQVNIRTVDDRSVTDPNLLAHKIYERL